MTITSSLFYKHALRTYSVDTVDSEYRRYSISQDIPSRRWRREQKEHERETGDQRRAERTKRQRLYYSTITGLIPFVPVLFFLSSHRILVLDFVHLADLSKATNNDKAVHYFIAFLSFSYGNLGFSSLLKEDFLWSECLHIFVNTPKWTLKFSTWAAETQKCPEKFKTQSMTFCLSPLLCVG